MRIRDRVVSSIVATAATLGAATACIWLIPAEADLVRSSPTSTVVEPSPATPMLPAPAADAPGRRLEELYAQAAVVAQVRVLAEPNRNQVEPLAVFKSDGLPIREIVQPIVFCGSALEAGVVYLVFADRVDPADGVIRVLEQRANDEVRPYLATAPGGASARLLERLARWSGVEPYAGNGPRSARAAETVGVRRSGCQPG